MLGAAVEEAVQGAEELALLQQEGVMPESVSTSTKLTLPATAFSALTTARLSEVG